MLIVWPIGFAPAPNSWVTMVWPTTAIFGPVAAASSSNSVPACAFQFLILKNDGFVPLIDVFQFAPSAVTCTFVCNTGATQRTVGTSPFSSAVRSSQVSAICEPAPPRTPPDELEPLL